MSSLQRAPKRPRPGPDPSPADKKSTKKSKSSKKRGAASADPSVPESTANPEGHMMAQALSTFNALEQSRFEAFRRSTFRGDAVGQYVAYRLAEHQERRHAQREGTRRLLGAASLGVSAASGRTAAALRWDPTVAESTEGGAVGRSGGTGPAVPRLEDLVAPNTAQEITVVVSALAKCYAQRLVTASRRVAAAEGHPDGARLLPRHILEAHRHRSLAGIDPGFFLQPPQHARRLRGAGSGSVCGPFSAGGGTSAAAAAALGVTDKNRLRYIAALRAQEEYDKRVAEEEKKMEEGEEADVKMADTAGLDKGK